MKKIFSIFILISSVLNAQEIDFKIHWGNNFPDNVNENIPNSLCEEHLNYNIDRNSSPYFQQQIPFNLPVDIKSKKIVVIDSIPLTDEEIKFISQYEVNEKIRTVKLFGAGKNQHMLQLKVNPFFKSGNQLYKIVRFKVELNTTPENSLKKIAKSNSVLSEGAWYKFRIKNTGIYKLSYSEIKNLGFESPENIRIYGNGGAMLSKYNIDFRKTDLQEIPLWIEKGSDNQFNNGDYLLFFAEGPVVWNYNADKQFYKQEINSYSNYGYYFLTDSKGPANRIQEKSVNETTNYSTSTGDFFAHYEKELINILNSGRLFFSDKLDGLTDFDTTFIVHKRVTDQPVSIEVCFAGRSKSGCTLNIQANGELIDKMSIGSVTLGNTQYNYAIKKTQLTSIQRNEQNIHVNLDFNKTSTSDEGWLDYITINGRKELYLENNFLLFSDQKALNYDIAEFNISNATAQTVVWNITDINDAYALSGNLSGNNLKVKDIVDSRPNFYVALNIGTNFPSPELTSNRDDVGWVKNQNLHNIENCDLLIVTHPDFLLQANELGEWHRNKDQLDVSVVTTDQVYNEYSSGKPDVTAIRDFARDLYNQCSSFRYLLLYGDGSVNNLYINPKNPNFIPTFQSDESLYQSHTYVSDDFFGFLDDNEGDGNGVVDIGIGRIPVGDTIQGRIVLDKIKSYYQNLVTAKWNNNITFIGDDEDNNIHMDHADKIARMVEVSKPEMTVEKIYIDAYEQISTASGSRYPEVNETIDQAMLKGQFLINYSGHGGIQGLAHERIITLEQIDNWNNRNKYPIFVTATCELSAFDHIDNKFKKIEKTAGEHIFLKEAGGAVAMLTTTRLVYSSANLTLNTAFYNTIFNRDEQGNFYRLGDVVKKTKGVNPGINTSKFALLGDPALPLAFAKHTVITDSINHRATNINDTAVADTIYPLEEVKIHGHIEDYFGNSLNNYNGVVYVTVSDQKRRITTRANDGEPFEYNTQNGLLFSGKASVVNGEFDLTFVTPKDMSISYGNGKIGYFATDSITSASGYYTNFIVGGINENSDNDNTGPEIELFINDTLFVNGGLTNQNPYLLAFLKDETGINVSNYGVGHDIIAYLDNDPTNLYVLNDYYEANIDNYNSGSLYYPIQNLSDGYHTVTVRAWDIYNNVSEATIEFVVNSNEIFVVKDINAYPNPFNEYVYFVFDHNFAEEELEVTIDIFDVNGKQIYRLQQEIISTGFTTTPIRWDAGSTGYIPSGVYIYRATIKPKNANNSVVLHNKIIKTR